MHDIDKKRKKKVFAQSCCKVHKKGVQNAIFHIFVAMSKVNHSHIYKKQGVLLHPQFLRPCKEDELESILNFLYNGTTDFDNRWIYSYW